MNKHIKFAVTASVLLMLFVLNIAEAAWTAPTAVPPGNNTSAPINVSATYQTKIGGFGLSGVLSALGAGNRVTSPKFCLNADGSDTNCVSGSWPSGGGTSGVTSITAGTGITVNQSTGAVTITNTNPGQWLWNGTSLYHNAASNVGIGTNAPYSGAKLHVDATGKSYGIYSSGAYYGILGSGTYGLYGNGGYVGIYSWGGTASIQLNDSINWGGGYGTQNKVGTKILGSKTTDGMAQWYTPAELGLSGGTSGGITGSGTGWTVPVFGGSAGVAGQTSISDSPITASIGASGDSSTMVVNMFPNNLWGTKTNTALNINGKIKIADGYQGTNKILASDANGLATWRTASELGLGGVTNLTSYTQLPSGSIAGFCRLAGTWASVSLPVGAEYKVIAPATASYSTDIMGKTNACGCASGWTSIIHSDYTAGNGYRLWSTCMKN